MVCHMAQEALWRWHAEQKFYYPCRKLRIEMAPITSACRSRRYSRAALPDIFGRAIFGGKLHPFSVSICSVVEIATAGGLYLKKILYFKMWTIVEGYLDFSAVDLSSRKHGKGRSGWNTFHYGPKKDEWVAGQWKKKSIPELSGCIVLCQCCLSD